MSALLHVENKEEKRPKSGQPLGQRSLGYVRTLLGGGGACCIANEAAAPLKPSISNWLLRLHVGAQDGVDAGLVAGVLAEPAQQVGVQADGHDFLRRGHDDLGGFPEGGIGGVSVRVRIDSFADCVWGQAAQTGPVGAGGAFGLRSFRV